MTRTNARELTVQFCFALSFQDISVETFLARHLNRDTFALLAPEDPLCAEFPDDNQLTYISKLVTGVSQHAPELDGYIARYSVGWNFSRISRLAAAIMRSPCMKSCICPIYRIRRPSTKRWRSQKDTRSPR